jgi:quinol monooxygenase YgiN
VIIVSGLLRVDPRHRNSYLADCVEVTRLARAAAGCIDFHLSADPVESDRINIFEQWESDDAVEAFRGSGPAAEQTVAIVEAIVAQHEIASSTSLT